MTTRLLAAFPAVAFLAIAQTQTPEHQESTHSEIHSSQTTTTTRSGSPGQWTGRLVDATCTPGGSSGSASRDASRPRTDTSTESKSASSSQSSTSSADRERSQTSHSEQSSSETSERTAHRSPGGKHWTDEQVRSCAPTEATTQFALVTADGRYLKLDSSGSSMAAKSWRNEGGAGSTAAPAEGRTVTVYGTMRGGTVMATKVQ